MSLEVWRDRTCLEYLIPALETKHGDCLKTQHFQRPENIGTWQKLLSIEHHLFFCRLKGEC